MKAMKAPAARKATPAMKAPAAKNVMKKAPQATKASAAKKASAAPDMLQPFFDELYRLAARLYDIEGSSSTV